MQKNLWRHSNWRKSSKRSTISNRALIMLEGQSSRSLRRTSQYASYWSSWSEIWTSYRQKIRDQYSMSGWKAGLRGQVQLLLTKQAQVLTSLNKYWLKNRCSSNLQTLQTPKMVTLNPTSCSLARSKQSLSCKRIQCTKRYQICLLFWNKAKMMHKFRCLTGKTL